MGTIMEKAVCPNCGKELSVCNYINETEAIMKCRHCNKKFKITFDEKTFPSKINSFNWGAFLSGGLWCLFNGKIGLGLFMSYSNIRAHFNGNITVQSVEGSGTTFKIYLPL